jgi:hypothetical protein
VNADEEEIKVAKPPAIALADFIDPAYYCNCVTQSIQLGAMLNGTQAVIVVDDRREVT